MGDPKFTRKSYATPSHPWNGPRISEEKMIVHKYGLKNKRELWKSQTILRDLRRQARQLQARLSSEDEQALKERDGLIERLQKMGLLTAKGDLTDVLALEVETLLSRRLQTQIYLKGLARTVKQARQLIVHGHIAIEGRKVTVPGYLVTDSEGGLIDYYNRSPFLSDMHPERPVADFAPSMTTVKDERRASEERERDMRRGRELERIKAMRQAIAGDIAGDAEPSEEDGDKPDVDPDAETPEGDEKKPEEKGKVPDEEKGEKVVKKDEEKVEKKAEKKADQTATPKGGEP